MEKDKIIQAGQIASQVVKYAKSIIKKDMLLLDIAEKIESKIIELGGKPAFPVNLSMDEMAAHYTPTHDDKIKSYGLLKVDLGVNIDGWTADTAFSIDLENLEENKKLIKVAEEALENSLDLFSMDKTTSEIGEIIEKTIKAKGFQPVINLSGHSMDQYDLHSGITIPNINDNKNIKLSEGIYAIEPFVTTGSGKVQDGNISNIYQLVDDKKPRSPKAREILKYIKENYSTLPFCSRWIVKEFSPSSSLALKELVQNKNLHSYAQLIETTHSKVAQAEHTVLLVGDEKIVTTR